MAALANALIMTSNVPDTAEIGTTIGYVSANFFGGTGTYSVVWSSVNAIRSYPASNPGYGYNDGPFEVNPTSGVMYVNGALNSAVHPFIWMWVEAKNTANQLQVCGRVEVTIREGSSPIITSAEFSPATFFEDGGTTTLTVHLSRTSSSPITVDLYFTGTATEAVDYTSPAQLTFPAGQASASIILQGVADTIFEGDETIIVNIVGLPTGTGYTPATATIIQPNISGYQLLGGGPMRSFMLSGGLLR